MKRIHNWDEFKKYLDKGLSPQEVKDDENEDQTWLYVTDGYLQFGIRLYDGTTYSDPSTEWTDYVNNYQSNANQNLNERTPFAAKRHSNGKKLFRRVHGFKLDLDGTLNQQNVTFTIPYVSCLMTAAEIVDAVAGDHINFKILDSTTGLVTTVPNYTLNQFGFNVYPAPKFHQEISEYDSELFGTLQVCVEYTPVNTVMRSVYFNLVLHELV